MERCPSGLRCKPGTFVWGQLHRGFESRLLRILNTLKSGSHIASPIHFLITSYKDLIIFGVGLNTGVLPNAYLKPVENAIPLRPPLLNIVCKKPVNLSPQRL